MKQIISKTPLDVQVNLQQISSHFGAFLRRMRTKNTGANLQPISSKSPVCLQKWLKFFQQNYHLVFWCSRVHLVLKKVVVDIFIFILCDMIVYVGIFKEEIQHQSTKLFSDMAWSHGMANGWLEKLFCTSDIDVSNTRRLSGNENVSKRLSSHPPRTAHRKKIISARWAIL